MYQGLYIFLAMLGFFLIGMIYLWGKSKDANYGKLGTPPDSASWTSMLKKSLALVTFFGVTLGIILFCFWLRTDRNSCLRSTGTFTVTIIT